MTDSQSTPSNAADSAAQTAVGALLRQSREGAGLNIADAARALRISQKYLEALEDGRHTDLPGAAYAIGFVRSYAEHLHLDSDEIVRRYKDEAAGAGNRNDLVFPKPIVDGGVPGGAVLGLGVMVAAVAYGVWYWNSTNTEVEIARVEVVPEHMAVPKQATAKAEEPEPVVEKPVEMAEPDTAPINNAPTETAASISEPVAEAPVDEVVVSAVSPTEPAVPVAPVEPVEIVNEAVAPAVEPAMAPADSVVEPIVEPVAEDEVDPVVAPEATPIAEPVVEAAAPQAEDVPQVTDTPAAQAVETASVEADAASDTVVASVAPVQRQDDGPSRITVRAKSNSWIQVRDEIADRLLFTRLLREGQEYQVPNRDGLRLMTGNAGALELLVDGTAVPAIGDVGEVRRNVELDVVKLQNGSAVSE